MHELGICEAILRIVEERSDGRQVKRVSVRSGVYHHLLPEVMQQGFEFAAAGGPAEGALFDLEIAPAAAACNDCQHQFEVTQFFSVCPACGSPNIRVQEDDQLVIKSIEYGPTNGEEAHPA